WLTLGVAINHFPIQDASYSWLSYAFLGIPLIILSCNVSINYKNTNELTLLIPVLIAIPIAIAITYGIVISTAGSILFCITTGITVGIIGSVANTDWKRSYNADREEVFVVPLIIISFGV
ncbi:MAG TPA: hypothetical protein PLZ51_17295, partial [Aggregatilineales bacterium]|nr:hypothetical protein [Aggregatilineales bacterium]